MRRKRFVRVLTLVQLALFVVGLGAVAVHGSTSASAQSEAVASRPAPTSSAASSPPVRPTVPPTSSTAGPNSAAAPSNTASPQAPRPTVAPPIDWAPGSAEAEELPSGRVITDPHARRGAAVTSNGPWNAALRVERGPYSVTARIRSSNGRASMTWEGERVGEAGLTGAWQTIETKLFADGPGNLVIERVGGGTIDVDWIQVSVAAPGLTVRGRQILDASGRPYTPRGVNRTSLESTVDGWWWSWQDAAAIKAWGATIVRIPLSQMFWLDESCYSAPRYRANVDKAVRLITSRGMVALLDLHKSSRGRTCGINDREVMPDDLSVQFWKEVAARYADNPLVAFDLYNEPRTEVTQAELWRDGGEIGDWHAVGMQDLYEAVRSTGATNVVFASGGGWATNLRVAQQRPLDGYGIVYAPHLYNDGHVALPQSTDRQVLGIAADHPVVVTEFGTNLSSGAFNRAVGDWAEQHGFGWIAYVWSAGNGTRWELLRSWQTHEPNNAGEPVRAALRAAAH